MLFKRYANPFILLDDMIASGRFEYFVDKLISKVNEENVEKVQWEFYLHKVFDKSYGDYLDELKADVEPMQQNEASFETTIKEQIQLFDIELNN